MAKKRGGGSKKKATSIPEVGSFRTISVKESKEFSRKAHDRKGADVSQHSREGANVDQAKITKDFTRKEHERKGSSVDEHKRSGGSVKASKPFKRKSYERKIKVSKSYVEKLKRQAKK